MTFDTQRSPTVSEQVQRSELREFVQLSRVLSTEQKAEFLRLFPEMSDENLGELEAALKANPEEALEGMRFNAMMNEVTQAVSLLEIKIESLGGATRKVIANHERAEHAVGAAGALDRLEEVIF
jgi:uncharacterized protein with von Willebrand factor type A (vWA) domain